MSSRRAVILGGTGGIGSAVARELLDASGRGGDDWQVDVIARRGGPAADSLTARGATFTAGDRRDTSTLRDVLRPGADLLVDTVGLTRDDATQLLPFLDDVGSTVFVSSRAVYVDDQGRHANSTDKPVFGAAVTEIQPTVTAGDGDPTSRDGYGAAKVASEQVLLDHGAPVTVLRPSKVYGIGIGRPREWFVVRRVLDGRERILLADHGRGVDHTTAASGIGSLVRLVADAPDRRILNVADDSAPTALEIVRTIAGHLDHRFDEVLLDADAPAFVGTTPWSSPSPFVLDTTAARTLGWQPPTFATAVLPELDWLVETAQSTPADGDVPWADDPFWERMFDYGPEDAALALLSLGLG
ncbi:MULTISPECIES: NAD-dependent epimerase/dehydratase family protein [unclassified Curtobacterium]|uniref:NAD-dependent epimerase/dehydratase family protein n=1 Tax=unclassified Curtobacterium TaxID=257496 RepID=UPI000F4F5053|nr:MULTISPECIES: NAD-dependent epimerase/dehydratase family protein [unclassified Curtobacterium]RPE82492.1 nucleoside-diphosphate-sugar epimerase [Curtobacterium sp. PhB137]TCL78548.1 nucleoside-diphosphate-sugar epimerase [Curtobacterium sp. PhB128]TCL95309.1 nucleoside-diphosphate-sugar epimerase [Curtobacterium sp. PhB138]TCU48252.1 nucleoside-diphosphate-sugar epimerase [Curtobacterium sp. PhB146]